MHSTIMELGTERPSPLWFFGPKSIMVVYMDPLGSVEGGRASSSVSSSLA